jgi:Tn3 transposase DDE domain
VWIAFLLRFLHDAELRRVIQAATNTSESFYRFVQMTIQSRVH